MKVIDLSHDLITGMPVFPGTDAVSLERTALIEKDGFNEIRINISTHTGTHIDCPKHMMKDGSDTETLPVSKFIGKAFVIDCYSSPVKADMLMPHEDKLRQASFVLFRTNHSRYWGSEAYFGDFPVADEEAARYLLHFSLKGVGIDAPSFDPVGSAELLVHHLLLSKDMILIENLVHLDQLPPGLFWFSCFPLRIKEGDGSPVRAVAWTE